MNQLNELRQISQRKAVEFMKKNWPHYTFFVVIVLAYTLFSTGCATADKAFIETNYEASQTLGSDLIGYINEDDAINDENKDMRVHAVKSWQSVCKTAYEVHFNNGKAVKDESSRTD